MLKYSLILLGAYFLYYAGNIVYDLFLKKEKTVHTDAAEEFSLADFAQSENIPPSSVGIEDVENIRTPKSFLKSELPLSSPNQSSFEENPDLEELRRRFESEQDLDGFENVEEPEKNITAETKVSASRNEENIQNHNNEELELSIQKSNRNKWYQLLNLAETSVQMISHTDGYKIYQSTM